MWLPGYARPQAPFPHRYAPARQAFLESLEALKPRMAVCHESHPYPVTDGQPPLHTDVVWLGNPQSEKVLALISGTHGVEGFCGSAIQRDFLQALQTANDGAGWPNDIGCLLVHALNPFGMQWWRRCDAWGIDLNRNFVDFTQAPPANTDFLKLQPFLNELDYPKRRKVFAQFIQDYGQTAFEKALSGGQYFDPHGAFYGGTGAAPSRQLIDRLLSENDFRNKRLIVLDLHSGLGPFGYGELICDHEPDSAQAAFARRIFGHTVTLPALGTSSSVPKAGLQDYAWHAVMGDSACFLTLEYGSYGTEALFDVILDDHILHRTAMLDEALFRQPIKQAIREHFCPDSRPWEQLVLAQARIHIRTALEALAS